MKNPKSSGRLVRNGKVQLRIKDLAKNRKRVYAESTEEQLERGRRRKAIEDRKIERELLGGDLW